MEGGPEREIIPSAPERRAPLIREMKRLAEAGWHCGACSGVCCTFIANSMQVTPVEALDLKNWLITQDRWDEELLTQLEQCVRNFRLDQETGDGRRILRRTYTCPFYRPGPLGCSISPKHKPYGCLAFNARTHGQTEGGNCASDQVLLEATQSPDEELLNHQLATEWHWHAEKYPLPVALLKLQSPKSN